MQLKTAPAASLGFSAAGLLGCGAGSAIFGEAADGGVTALSAPEDGLCASPGVCRQARSISRRAPRREKSGTDPLRLGFVPKVTVLPALRKYLLETCLTSTGIRSTTAVFATLQYRSPEIIATLTSCSLDLLH